MGERYYIFFLLTERKPKTLTCEDIVPKAELWMNWTASIWYSPKHDTARHNNPASKRFLRLKVSSTSLKVFFTSFWSRAVVLYILNTRSTRSGPVLWKYNSSNFFFTNLIKRWISGCNNGFTGISKNNYTDFFSLMTMLDYPTQGI